MEALNRIVTAYLEFAELQAMNRRPMTMRDWIAKLDDFLRLGDRDVLTHAGKISTEDARIRAEGEYERWHKQRLNSRSEVEQHFAEAAEKAKRITARRSRSSDGKAQK